MREATLPNPLGRRGGEARLYFQGVARIQGTAHEETTRVQQAGG